MVICRSAACGKGGDRYVLEDTAEIGYGIVIGITVGWVTCWLLPRLIYWVAGQ